MGQKVNQFKAVLCTGTATRLWKASHL